MFTPVFIIQEKFCNMFANNHMSYPITYIFCDILKVKPTGTYFIKNKTVELDTSMFRRYCHILRHDAKVPVERFQLLKKKFTYTGSYDEIRVVSIFADNSEIVEDIKMRLAPVDCKWSYTYQWWAFQVHFVSWVNRSG